MLLIISRCAGVFLRNTLKPSVLSSTECHSTQRPAWPAGDQLWFNSRICAGEKSGVAGVELATASEPPARQPRIWGRRPSGVDPSHPWAHARRTPFWVAELGVG